MSDRVVSGVDYRFGPFVTEEGVIFRLWGPAAKTVDLVLEVPAETPAAADEPALRDVDPSGHTPHTRAIPLSRDTVGWWRSPPQAAPPGSAYRFRINGDVLVPDPASRAQRDDVHGPSILTVENGAVENGAVKSGENPSPWRGRPWEETVLYEVHLGTGTAAGTFRSLVPQLPHLAQLGITAVELMPIADFPGSRNWGYDGVLPFAPDQVYGSVSDLKELISAAHRENLSIWLDVVYNHFGPEGNYLGLYAPQFFNKDVHTPWGAAIDFTVPEVRRFFIENALYWIMEIGFDGLRLDAVHAIHDPSPVHFLEELAATVRAAVHAGNTPDRHVHLVLENDRNEARFLAPGYSPEPEQYTAQWNDDIHHAWHVLLTGESHGYYREYANTSEAGLLPALATGFIRKGETSTHLPPTRFVSFLQNHDQVGNRAFGERLITLTEKEPLRVAIVTQILSPQIPLLFMGEPWGETAPFQFFCDFGEDLSRAVQEGRRREFGLDDLPDPTAAETVRNSTPATAEILTNVGDRGREDWIRWYRDLLVLRRRYLIPLLATVRPGTSAGGGDEATLFHWNPGWAMYLNLSDRERPLPETLPASWSDAPADEPVLITDGTGSSMAPWSVRVFRRKP